MKRFINNIQSKPAGGIIILFLTIQFVAINNIDNNSPVFLCINPIIY